MFTPQKIAIENNFALSGSFEKSLRKYNDKPLHKNCSPLKQLNLMHKKCLSPFSNKQRVKRYQKVRKEEMQRSRSKIRQRKQNKKIRKKINIFNQQEVQNKQNEQKQSKDIITFPDILINNKPDCILFCQKRQQNQHFTQVQKETTVNLKQLPSQKQNINNVSQFVQQIVNISQNNPNSYPSQINQSLPQISFCTSFEHSQANSVITFSVQQSYSYITINNKQIRYRISLRQLNRIRRKFKSIECLVNYLIRRKPHLQLVKNLITDVLNKHFDNK